MFCLKLCCGFEVSDKIAFRHILTGNTVNWLSWNLTYHKWNTKQTVKACYKRSSIFRERRNQCSPCFEIRELFGANRSILLELIANSTPVCILNFGQITSMTFQNGSRGRLAVANLSGCDYPLWSLALQSSRFAPLQQLTAPACWQDRTDDSRKQACTNSSDSAWFYGVLPKN